ncbi:MAG: hypothetical protein AAFR58_09630 [Cyanobacteria bacterium J06627_28]
MKDTDMDLQAIKEKLQQLQAEPVESEVLAMPWSSSQQMALPIHRQHIPTANGQTTNKNSTAAIEKLQQRSVPSATSTHHGNAQTVNGYGGDLIAQQIYRLEILANNINARSQEQAAELIAMKRSAQQAAVGLRRQGIHSHPQLDVIETFLSQQSETSVPRIERDSSGQFHLNDAVVYLNKAEQDAQTTAQSLRNRRAPQHLSLSQPPFSQSPFSQPIANTQGTAYDEALESATPPRNRRRQAIGLPSLLAGLRRRMFTKRIPAASDSGAYTQSHGRFSWTDGAIWFCGAAIARIIIETVVLSFPALRMPMLLVLFSAISFSIYRVVTSKSTSFTSAYRLAIVLLGLFMGGSF